MPTTHAGLEMGPGRWVHNWDAENPAFWEGIGRATARTNLRWSIFAEFLGFVVWQLFAVVAVYLPAAGFELDNSQLFWLISMPSLVGATLRIPYTFMVARFGGRNWTIVSALLLLIPAGGLALAVSNPATPFWALLTLAGLAGFGGGNFASSMANITYFFPASQKGWALGLNAAGGNLGAAVAQLLVPIAITVFAAGSLQLPLAGLIWIPLILLAAWGAKRNMHNLSNARSDVRGALACLKEPHLWIIAALYIGTFGSFIGFSAVFPKLIRDTFPDYSTFALGTAALSLAFLGPLVGSLARPAGGKLADRHGGARITLGALGVMGLVTLAVVMILPSANFWVFLSLFLVLFTASGIGNGSTYRMIPVVFALRAGTGTGNVSAARKGAAALGLISAIGAYGGFLIPQALGLSLSKSGSYTAAFILFVALYAALMFLLWFCYIRRGTGFAGRSI
ncbi:MFS transporter [Paeniglutamicibacter psychrophenolicus]|uniref:NNP family nitrate/nitrite transporter-like MFS transporter n=1 Tax=Paeniglutamicibacter psychrophenolicus TaxID=257454 RepID=A0ABS4WAK6_9MICC|nr:MFS transporter [Paeniglutamicibacter psychrophenolicus]MBP2373242.1 NNP family nitrate/nitrite transporter-like MFS transporter [Paeniglutamicibacter psychrophenolicus]